MDEKQIIEKRSSFRGWKERNKGKSKLKIYAIGIVAILIIFSVLATYPYLNKKDGHTPIKNKKDNSSNDNSHVNTTSKRTPEPTPQITPTVTPNATPTVTPIMTENKIITGKIGIPFMEDGFEITVKSAARSITYASVWITVKNTDNKEKSFKIDFGTVLIDNMIEQYENIHLKRSAEIVQTNLAAKAMREGAIFFEPLKESRRPEKLLLNINGQKAEIILEK